MDKPARLPFQVVLCIPETAACAESSILGATHVVVRNAELDCNVGALTSDVINIVTAV